MFIDGDRYRELLAPLGVKCECRRVMIRRDDSLLRSAGWLWTASGYKHLAPAGELNRNASAHFQVEFAK